MYLTARFVGVYKPGCIINKEDYKGAYHNEL